MKKPLTRALHAFLPLLLIFTGSCQAQMDEKHLSKTADQKPSAGTTTDTATLGAGCFWCVEAVFQEVKGVLSVESGYCGGFVENPTYKAVCTGATGHAEVARLVYDPAVVSFAELLEVFWLTHDPTQLNRQGNDVGTQYRSAIFYHNEQQRAEAEHYLKELNASGAYAAPVVTTIEPMTKFYPAEGYHQNYYNQNSSQPYCAFIIQPKLEKFRASFAHKVK